MILEVFLSIARLLAYMGFVKQRIIKPKFLHRNPSC